jgi:hypothetical protein
MSQRRSLAAATISAEARVGYLAGALGNCGCAALPETSLRTIAALPSGREQLPKPIET